MRMIATAVALALAMAVPAAAEQVQVTIAKRDCARLVRHSPSADVAYQPGVDAKGRKVAPADVPGSAGDIKWLPDVLEFPVSINPVNYAQRNAAMKDKAAAEAAIVSNYEALQAAKSSLTQLETTETTLTATGTTLATQLSTLETSRDDVQAAITALEAQVTAGTLSKYSASLVSKRQELTKAQAAVDAKQAEIDANTAALATNATQQAAQQAIIDGAPATETAKTIDRYRAESTVSSLSARGLDNTSMTVATVAYDMAKGVLTINGQPVGGADQAALAEACRKMGVR